MNIIVSEGTKIALAHLYETLEVAPYVTAEEILVIGGAFGLGEMSLSELQDTRNQVVKYCSDIKLDCRAKGDWAEYDLFQNLMSKVECVINTFAFKSGGQRG